MFLLVERMARVVPKVRVFPQWSALDYPDKGLLGIPKKEMINVRIVSPKH
jgi:hypothetical protein